VISSQDGQAPEEVDLDLDPTITNIIGHWRDQRAVAAAAAAQEAAAEGEGDAADDSDTGSDSGSDDGDGDGDGQAGESDSCLISAENRALPVRVQVSL
jgi:hypothetical protein